MIAYVVMGLVAWSGGMSLAWWITNRRRAKENLHATLRLESMYQAERSELLLQAKHLRDDHAAELETLAAESSSRTARAVAAAVTSVEAQAHENSQLLLTQRREADELLRDSIKRHAAESRQAKAHAAQQTNEFEGQVVALRNELDILRTVVALPATIDAMANNPAGRGIGKPVAATERARAVDFSLLAARVRGVALVDAVTIADADGMSMTGGASTEVDHVATVVPGLHKANRAVIDIVGQLHGATMLTSSMRMVEYRRLPAWTNNAWLVALARSQRPNASVLDAAVAYATLMRPRQDTLRTPVPAGTNQHIGRGSNRADAIAVELEAQRAGVKASVFALLNGADVAAGVIHDGPTAAQCDVLAATLHQLRRVGRGALHEQDLVRLEMYAASGLRFGLAPLSFNSKLALMYITNGRSLEDLEIERSIGHLRRLLSATGASTGAAA